MPNTKDKFYQLTIDDREKAVIPFFTKHELKSKVGRITTGDYVLLSQRKDQTNTAKPVIVFERKSWKDFSDSFKDGRFDNNNNLREYQEKYNSKIIFILEGQAFPTPNRKFRGIAFKNIQRRIDHMMLVDGFHMVQTRDPEGTAKRIVEICFAYMNYASEIVPIKRGGQEKSDDSDSKSDDSDSKSDDSDSDSKSDDCSKSIVIPQDLKKIRQKTNDQVLTDMWRSLPQVSAATANIMSEHFTIQDLICGKIKVETVSDLTYPSGTKIGNARAKKILAIGNNNILEKRGNVVNLAKSIEFNKLQEKLLCSIKGVSRDLAKQICKKYSLRELCLEVDEKTLANFKRGDGPKARNLGPALSKRILDLLKCKNN